MARGFVKVNLYDFYSVCENRKNNTKKKRKEKKEKETRKQA